MVALIVSTNEAYLGWIMYLALQMQSSIHLPRHMSHRITSRGRRRAFPLPLSNRGWKTNSVPSLSPEAQLARPGTCGDAHRGDFPPQHLQELPKDQELQHPCHRAATSPAAIVTSPAAIVTSPAPFPALRWLLRALEVAGGCDCALDQPFLPSLLPSSFPGTLLELRTNCNYFSR